MTTTEQTTDDAVKAALIRYGVLYRFEGGERMTKRDADKPWECFQWRVTFAKGTTWQTFDYYCGLAHVIKAKRFFEPDKPRPPTAATVLHSLLLDATATEENFSDWCSNYGYSDDSMKALRVYQDCIETGRRLRTLFTSEQRAELAKLLEDY